MRSDHIHYRFWYEITYPFRNCNGCVIKVWEWISKLITHFNRMCDLLSMQELNDTWQILSYDLRWKFSESSASRRESRSSPNYTGKMTWFNLEQCCSIYSLPYYGVSKYWHLMSTHFFILRKRLKLVLGRFVVTMHEGSCEPEVQSRGHRAKSLGVLSVQTRVHCYKKTDTSAFITIKKKLIISPC